MHFYFSLKVMSEICAESNDGVSEGTGVILKLTESDIPGTSLSEPLETHTIPDCVVTPSCWMK